MRYKDSFDFILKTIGTNPNDCKTSRMKNNFKSVRDALYIVRHYYGFFHNIEKKNEEVKFDNYEGEEWRPVVNFEGLYEVSSMIRIRNSITLKTLKVYERKGYNIITLSKNKKKYVSRMARLVAAAFIPNPENKPFVDHKNANSLDDRPENLRWVTHKENMNNSHTKSHISQSSGEPILQYTQEGDFIKEYDNSTAAAKENDWPISSSIRNCCKKNGKQFMYKGYIWKFKKDVPENKRYCRQTDVDYYLKRKRPIPIIQLSLKGQFIKEWPSVSQAINSTGIRGIKKCNNGKCIQAGGYIWKCKIEMSFNEISNNKQH